MAGSAWASFRPIWGGTPSAISWSASWRTSARTAVETICYSDRIVKDDLTHRLQAAATQWRDVVGMSDQRLAEQIRADRIDILFDLAGHTAHNRLLVFARKPAPIQITWIGYVGHHRAGGDGLPAGRPPRDSAGSRAATIGSRCCGCRTATSATTRRPTRRRSVRCRRWSRAYVTFGSFNNPAKITPQVVAVWAGDPAPAADGAAGPEVSGLGRSGRAAAVSSICLPPSGDRARAAGVVAGESP